MVPKKEVSLPSPITVLQKDIRSIPLEVKNQLLIPKWSYQHSLVKNDQVTMSSMNGVDHFNSKNNRKQKKPPNPFKKNSTVERKKRLLTSRPPLHVLPNPKKKALQKDSKRFEKNSRAMKVDIKYVRVAPKTNLSNVSLPLPKEFYPSNLKV